jgi:1-acyl-sn-glycerol-3-phosphate acyltransferase
MSSDTRGLSPEKRFFRMLATILRPIVALFYPMSVTGLQNVPEGAVIICANHSSYIDPVLIALALGGDKYIKFMAKKELFSVPVLGWILRKLGVFPVDRDASDIEAIRTAMKWIKSGGRVMMFPEGTRVSEDGAAQVKTGAVRIASKMKVPILPVNVPRDKKAFRRRRIEIGIGEPFYIEAKSHEEFEDASNTLMEKITALGSVEEAS